nr:reverse transcriptase domain-containing protein [Tanacetum cinerariifolium]
TTQEKCIMLFHHPIQENLCLLKPDLVFYDAPTVNETVPAVFNVEPSTTNPTQELYQSNRPSAPIIEDWGNPRHALKGKGVIDSRCSRHMIGNMSYLTDFKEINGGYVAFGGNLKGGNITGFMRHFGYPVTILNSVDPLGKFDGKADEGFLVGYSEPKFRVKEPESAVYVSPSSSAKSKKHEDKTKREAKALEDITYYDDKEDVGAEIDFSNLETNITVSLIPTTRVHKDHLVKQIIGDLSSAHQTRSMTRMVKEQGGSIDYEEFFAPVAKIEAIRLFLAYVSFMGFMVYQIDVKSAFLYGTIEEEVYVCQPQGFEDTDYPDKVYKVVKALYGLHQAPRACYLLENGFQRGKIDQTLFIKKQKGDILLVQVYVDDIIFGSTNKDLHKDFEKLTKDKFQMSSMGELTFFLDENSASIPIDTEKPLFKDPDDEDVDVHTYRAPLVFGHEKEDPHAHLRYFNKITSTMRVSNVPNSTIKLMLFPFSLEGAARIWLEKEPPRSILTWDDLVSKFINQFFPPSKATNLRNEITRFQQRFGESFSEAWDRFNDLLRACPHHGFSELHQLDTFYNALNVNDQDSLNSATGGNFLDKIPVDCLKIIKSKSKVRQTRAKAVVAKVNSNSSTPAVSSDVAELKDMVRALLLDKKNQYSAPTPSTPAPIKAVEPNCVTCGVHTSNSLSKAPVQPTVIQSESETPVFEPVVAPVSAPMPNLKPSIPYPSRHDNERRRDQANEQIKKFYEIFKDMSFEISFTDALMLMPKFASTLKALIGNKKKLSEMARTPMNEPCSAAILNKLPKKLGDPGKFFIPCEFPGMDECLALADLGASINLMPLSMWKGLSLLELTPPCMILELADRTESKPIGIAKDVKVKVGVFFFPADFMVVDFNPDPRVPLILGRRFLKTGRALIDVHKGELTIRIENEAITYNLDQTSRYSANYDQIMANKIDVTDEACEEYSQEVLGFSDVTASGSPTPSDDPIVSTTSPTLTPFGDSDFLLFEEVDAFLGLEDDPDSSELDPSYYNLEGDILLLEAILNSDPSPPLPNHEQSVPSFKEELKACEAKTIKSSIDEPPEVELKDLPPHLEYVLKSHKRAIAWKLSDLQGINPEFCTHKILMEEDYKPVVQHQRRVNPKIHDVIKKEVEKLLDAGLIYPISDSPWVSPVHCVPKKGVLPLLRMRKTN